jgi:large subunit ribosomal protein L9
MKVVLRQDVEKLGEAGSVQNVSNGYARNYLIPQGLAVVATAGELKTAAHNQAVKDRKVLRQEQQLQSLADKISGQKLSFTARAGEQGRLFGSVTAADIAEQLSRNIGEEIDRRKVMLNEPIRQTGTHTVAIHLVGRLRPEITVTVESDRQEEQASAADTAERLGGIPNEEAQEANAAAEEAGV